MGNPTSNKRILFLFIASLLILLFPETYPLAMGYMVAVAIVIPIFLNFADFGIKNSTVTWLFPTVVSILLVFFYDIIFFLGINIEQYLKYHTADTAYRGTYFDFIFGEWFRYRFSNYDKRSVVVFRMLFSVTVFVNIVCMILKAVNFRISMDKFDKLQ